MLKRLDALLRGQITDPVRLLAGRFDLPLRSFIPLAIGMGLCYGFFMGWYAVVSRPEPNYWQLLASTVKLPALFLLTLIVTFPSLYVFNALIGCRLGPADTLRLLIAAIVVNVTVAASLGPIVGFFTFSTTSYPFMVILNVVVLGLAGVVGLSYLLRTLQRLAAADAGRPEFWRPEARRDPVAEAAPAGTPGPLEPVTALPDPLVGQSRAIFRVWIVIYSLVGAQMGWLLRPFIGNPGQEFTWFRERSGNFFLALWTQIDALLHASNAGR